MAHTNDVKQAFDMWGRLLADIRKELGRVEGYWDHPTLRSYAKETLHTQLGALDAVIKQMGQPEGPYYSIVETVTGYGSDETYYLEVAHWAEFLRGSSGRCVFCGDDDWNDPTTRIGKLLKNHPSATTCPVCEGRAT